MFIPHSELILNSDNSVYHLRLKPGDLATTIITVGDPQRLELFRPLLSKIRTDVSFREFSSLTGTFKGKEISVVSTGIGTDNMDIVVNEIDALFNVDFESRHEKEEKTILEFIRVGTSGSIRKEVDIYDVIVSEYAIGLDGLLNYYSADLIREVELEELLNHSYHGFPVPVYAVRADRSAVEKFSPLGQRAITLTANGFYAPQSRQIRSKMIVDLPAVMKNISYRDLRVANIEMETAGLYGLAALLGHRAVALNLILANRVTGNYARDPESALKAFVEDCVQYL